MTFSDSSTVGSISITGNRLIKRKLIVDRIRLTEGKVFYSYLFYDDIDNIKSFYTESGFPNALISGSYMPAEEGIEIVIEIVENEPQIIDEINAKGKKAKELSKSFLKKRWSKRINDTIKIELTEYYQQRGYLYPEIVIDKRDIGVDSVALDIREDPGALFHFGEIYCVGLEHIPVKYVTREAPFVQGRLFDMRKVREFQRILYSLGIFEDINIKLADQNGIVNIIVEITEGRFKWVGVEFGYTSPAVGRIGFEWGDYNLWNKLHTLTFSNNNEVDSENDNHLVELDMAYTTRWVWDNKLNLGFVTSILNEKEDKGLKNELSFKLFGRKDLGKNDYIISGYEKKLNYYSELYDESIDISLNEWLITNSLFLNVYFDDLDNKIHPTISGYYLSGGIYINGGFMEGDFNYMKLIADAAYYKYLKKGATLAVLHGSYKKIGRVSGIINPPYDELFSMGGAFDIRGYDYKEIGDDFYSVIVGNAELRQRFYKTLWGAVFFDAGFAATEDGQLGDDDPLVTYGAGLRFVLPFIVIRSDYGFRDFKDKGTLHFVLGHIF